MSVCLTGTNPQSFASAYCIVGADASLCPPCPRSSMLASACGFCVENAISTRAGTPSYDPSTGSHLLHVLALLLCCCCCSLSCWWSWMGRGSGLLEYRSWAPQQQQERLVADDWLRGAGTCYKGKPVSSGTTSTVLWCVAQRMFSLEQHKRVAVVTSRCTHTCSRCSTTAESKGRLLVAVHNSTVPS